MINTWTALQSFDGNIKLGIGKKLYLGNDGDTYLTAVADNELDLYNADFATVRFGRYLTSFWRSLVVGSRFEGYGWPNISDGDVTPGIYVFTKGENYTNPTTITDFDNGQNAQFFVLLFLSGNVTIQHGTNIYLLGGKTTLFPANTMATFAYNSDTGIWYQTAGYIGDSDRRGTKTFNSNYIQLDEISKPTAVANHAFVYGKTVSASAEVMALDESDTETQLTSHDKDGYYVHRSTIPKRKLKLQIDIERFFRKHYPEYVNSENLELNRKQKTIRYKHLVKKNLIRLTIIGLVALEVTRLINPWG